MSDINLKFAVEAILLAAGRPVSIEQLGEMFDEPQRPSAGEFAAALAELAADYEPRGIELREVGSGWRVQVRSRHSDLVTRLWQERPSRYSRALLETLALIAYRQPITRGEIEEIRGVGISTTIMRTLHERNWIRVVGHREVPGRPELLGTTRDFLDYFGLQSLDDMPSLAELQDLENIKVQLELDGAESAVVPGVVTADVAPAPQVADDESGGEDDAVSASSDDVDADEPIAPTMVASPPSGHEH